MTDEQNPIPTSQSQDEKSKKRDAIASTAHYFVEIFVITLCVVLFLSAFVMRHTVVEGSSMQNTLQNGQHLLISDLFYTPERGDIVVLQSSDISIKTPIVKRIIAVGGDRIKMENGTVYVNGTALTENYVLDGCHISSVTSDFPEITVSEGHVFVLGDHRDRSSDSRVFGEVDERCILGKVYVSIYPLNAIGFPK